MKPGDEIDIFDEKLVQADFVSLTHHRKCVLCFNYPICRLVLDYSDWGFNS